MNEYLQLLHKVFGMSPDKMEARLRSLTDEFQNLIPNLKQRARNQMIDFRGFVIQDEVADWPDGLLKTLADIFLHACNNSLDHGFVFPKNRGEVQEPALIEIIAQTTVERAIEIRVRDNGAGINLSRLRSHVRNIRGERATESELMQLLFEDGLTTAETVNDTSGRGVGLAAIKEMVQRAGGQIFLKNRLDRQGAELMMRFDCFEATESLRKTV